jgi:hypothetical protein
MAGGRRLPPSMERLWLGELRRAHAIINIISNTIQKSVLAKAAHEKFVTDFYIILFTDFYIII